jgi:hypothetical protein
MIVNEFILNAIFRMLHIPFILPKILKTESEPKGGNVFCSISISIYILFLIRGGME